MSAASPPSLMALKARCQLTQVYRDIIRRRSIVSPWDGCYKEPGNLCPLLEKLGEQLWEPRGPYLPCFHSLMSYRYFTCRIPSQSHTHRKVCLLTPRRSTKTQIKQLKREAGRCPSKLWAILSDTPLVPVMSLFPFLPTVTRKVLTVYKSVLTTVIS